MTWKLVLEDVANLSHAVLSFFVFFIDSKYKKIFQVQFSSPFSIFVFGIF